MRISATLCFILISLTAFAQRIGNSPYPPVTTTPDTLYYVNISGMTASQRLTVVTLQGLLAKTKPQIMVDRGTKLYQHDLEHNYGIRYDSTYYNDFAGLIGHFAPAVSGYILCQLNDSTTNAAISLCSSRQAIAVIASDTAVMSANNIPMVLSTVGHSQFWALDSAGASFSDRIVAFQDYSKCSYLSDYSVFSGAFHFTAASRDPISRRAFGHLQQNSALLGWGSEGDMTAAASNSGIQVNAADWANNLSTYTNITVQAQQHVHSTDTNVIPGTHTVCFIMTDGDNIQWLLGDFADNSRWYGSPRRGEVPIGWTVSPALAELAPTALKYLYDSARSNGTGQDYFIAGPSGMGYYYPDAMIHGDSAAAISDRMMRKADLSIVNVIGGDYSETAVAPYFTQPDIDGVLYYTFSDGYTGLQGYSTCFNNKPFISARYTLWQSYSSAPMLADQVSHLPKDPTSAESYSLVSVHVWDHSVDSVIAAVQLFDSTIRVVSPDAFIKLYKKGTGCRAIGLGSNDIRNDARLQLRNVPNPSMDQTTISYHLDAHNFVSIRLYDIAGNEIRILSAGEQAAGDHSVVLDTHDLSAGIYAYSLSGPGINAVGRCEVVK